MQPPQLLGSVSVSTQTPLHSVVKAAQTHAPFASQVLPGEHAPQLPPQPSSPQTMPLQSGVQPALHMPPTHASLA